jgi:flavin-dependent dehydrogenase
VLISAASTKIRSEFDELLMNHARELGTKVYENTEVTEIHFDNIEGKTGKHI